MNNQSNNNKMGSWLKAIVFGIGAAGALYGAVKYILGQEEIAHVSSRCTRANSTRRRSLPTQPKECQICSERTDEMVVFLPCTHTIACFDCAARMRKCVICKMAIIERISEEGNKRIDYKSPKSPDDDSICPICFDNKRRIIFNCGHTFCKVCAEKLEECPLCRETVTSRNNFF